MSGSRQDSAVSVGIIGLGSMGKGVLYQSLITRGIRTAAVCDSDTDKAERILREFGLGYQITNDPEECARLSWNGQVAVYENGEALACASGIDAVVEATGTIIPGGRYSVKTIQSKKHLILMNSEVDLIFGAYLSRLAEENGVVSTSCDGDQYGVLKHLIDDITDWGFELVMAGNIKGFLDRSANPTSIIPEADKRNLDYRACASYTDGTKLNIEMSLIANALGLVTKTPGMHGPRCDHIDHVGKVFDFSSLWSEGKAMVDYVLGADPGGGVYAIGYCEHPYQRDMLRYYKMGDGPFYTFYRPYHLCHIESMRTITDAVLKGKSLLFPKHGFVTNVYAYAKKDLKKGDALDGIGGYQCYGLIENSSEQGISPGLPICLADEVTLNRDVTKGEKILFSDVDCDPSRFDFRLYELSMSEGGGKP